MTDHVLSKGSVDIKTTKLGVWAICANPTSSSTRATISRRIVRTLLAALAAVLTIQARISQPFDTNTVTDFDERMRRIRSNGYNFTDSFMAADEWRFCFQGPVTNLCMQVGMTDSSEGNFDEALTRCQLGDLLDREVCVDLDRRSSRGNNGGCLSFRDFRRHSEGGYVPSIRELFNLTTAFGTNSTSSSPAVYEPPYDQRV